MVCFSLILINTNSQEEGNDVCFSLILIARRRVMVFSGYSGLLPLNQVPSK